MMSILKSKSVKTRKILLGFRLQKSFSMYIKYSVKDIVILQFPLLKYGNNKMALTGTLGSISSSKTSTYK